MIRSLLYTMMPRNRALRYALLACLCVCLGCTGLTRHALAGTLTLASAIPYDGTWYMSANGVVLALECNFDDNSFRGVQGVTVQQCAHLCVRHAKCTHFTWHIYRETCHMKHNLSVIAADAVRRGERLMTCGIAPANI